MFWPVVLPFQITCVVMLVATAALTILASPKKWSRVKTCVMYVAMSLVAFIPSCTGIMMVADAIRFGDFSYASYSDIPDFRSQRYLPSGATDIAMRKHANGYLTRYKLAYDDFDAYLDGIWQKYGEASAVKRGGISGEGEPAHPDSFNMTFGDLGWNCPADAIVYYSPTEEDGGGAVYYVDSQSGIVFQRTGFW